MMVVGGAASRERSRAKVCPTKGSESRGSESRGREVHLYAKVPNSQFCRHVTLILHRSGGTQPPVKYGTRWENSANLKSSN
jgi:hypothetical protein